VDERRGMEEYSDEKAVEIEWRIDRASEFDTYARAEWESYQYSDYSFTGPEKYVYLIRGN